MATVISGKDLSQELKDNMKEQVYVLENVQDFELEHIFECGQCFRWNKEEDSSYTGVVGSNVLKVRKEQNNKKV